MNKSHLNELCSVFTTVRNKRDALTLLRDILTPQELAAVTQRWQIVKLLAKGVPHRKISRKLKVSISKVTRGSLALQQDHGAFKRLLKSR